MIGDSEKESKKWSEESLQSIPLRCFAGKVKVKKLTNHAAGIGTCTQCVMTITSYLSSEMHLGKFPDHTELQSWIVNFRTEVCSKAKNPTRAFLITPKSITGKDFLDCEELDLMMASALKRCYDKQTHFRKKISVEEQRTQKDNRFLRG